jgi:hypothetical protein
MSKRKNISDMIHGDRAKVRGEVRPADSDLSWFEQKYPNHPASSVTGSSNRSGDLFGGKSQSSYPAKPGKFVSCYESHPPLVLPGTNLVIYGGRCSDPIVKDADIYIGFDSTSMRYTERSYPWKKGYEFSFPIPDMGVPSKPDEFRKLVKWTRKKLEEGLKVHCGCIGGHGRTGIFLAALVSDFGEADAINYVRANYCKKAVESTSQVNFLASEYGIKPVEGYKSHYSGGTKSTFSTEKKHDFSKSSSRSVSFAPCKGSIWGWG